MAKPRSAKSLTFPYEFQHSGRMGKIYKLGNGTFKTHFIFAGEPKQNTHASFEAAHGYLKREFSKLDTDSANAVSLTPLNSDVRTYAELEHLLREQGGGATMREAVQYYLANHRSKRFTPRSVEKCVESFVASQRANNISPSQIKTLEKHFRRFKKEFATRKIHEISSLEIHDWLISRTDEKTGKPWSVKTRTSNHGSLVSLSLFARDTLKAIPGLGKTEFQLVKRPKKEDRPEVEIYSPDEMETLLRAAFEHDIDLIPVIVIGGFQGLRPAEIHGEGAKRPPLKWEAFIWDDLNLHITGQKVRSKANRDIPLHAATVAWLEPFRTLVGPIWKHRQAHSKKMIALRAKAEVRSIYDGFRHSYASYRIRHLKGQLSELAVEMGNSPREIIDSYKRNVTDKQADAWFGILPPIGYAEKVKAALAYAKPSDFSA